MFKTFSALIEHEKLTKLCINLMGRNKWKAYPYDYHASMRRKAVAVRRYAKALGQ